MRYLLTILAAVALSALVLVSGCGLISGMGDDSSTSDSAADVSTDASFEDTSFLSNDNNAFLSGSGTATTTEDSDLDPRNTLEIQLKDGTFFEFLQGGAFLASSWTLPAAEFEGIWRAVSQVWLFAGLPFGEWQAFLELHEQCLTEPRAAN